MSNVFKQLSPEDITKLAEMLAQFETPQLLNIANFHFIHLHEVEKELFRRDVKDYHYRTGVHRK